MNFVLSSTELPDFSWYNIPNGHKIYQTARKLNKWQGNWPNGQKYTNIFDCKTLQNISKLRFLVLKYTIWQPCRDGEVFFQKIVITLYHRGIRTPDP
jgi:hypothetical protein